MGNAHSDDFRNRDFAKEMASRYEKSVDTEDSRFGKVQVWHEKFNPNNKVLIKQRWTNTPQESQQLHEFVERRRVIDSPFIARLPYYEVSEEKQMFNTFYRHTLGFEFYPKTVASLIDKTKNQNYGLMPEESTFVKKLDYTNDEIVYLLKMLAHTTLAFKNHGYHHGDIQPHNIMIDNQGNLKIFDNSLINYGRTGYHKMVYGENYTTTLSPALCDALAGKVIEPKHNKVKSDIFSAGMTTLSAATQQDFNNFYDWKNSRVNMAYPSDAPLPESQLMRGNPNMQPRTPAPQAVQGQVHTDLHQDRVLEGLQTMQNNGYDAELVQIVDIMLSYNEADRPEPEHLLDLIHQYELRKYPPTERYLENRKETIRTVEKSSVQERELLNQAVPDVVEAPNYDWINPFTVHANVDELAWGNIQDGEVHRSTNVWNAPAQVPAPQTNPSPVWANGDWSGNTQQTQPIQQAQTQFSNNNNLWY